MPLGQVSAKGSPFEGTMKGMITIKKNFTNSSSLKEHPVDE